MRRGFTLIELLVVISIIGILSSIVLASLTTAKGKANDVRRLSDMHTVQTALELYFNSHNAYPTSNNLGCSGWESSGADVNNFVSALVTDGDMPRGMKDPSPSMENTCGNYSFYRYNAGDYGCDASKGPYYVVGIRVTDGYGTAKYPTSPGWACGTRDWQVEFSWVRGGFSN